MTVITQLLTAINESQVLQDAGLRAFAEVPATRPERFITIERTGGSREAWIDRSQFAIQVWAETQLAAYQLAEIVADELLKIPTTTAPIGQVLINTVSNFPDVSGAKQRYRAQIFAQVTTHIWR